MSTSFIERLYSSADSLLAKSIRLIGGRTPTDTIQPFRVSADGTLLVEQAGDSSNSDSAGKLRVSEPRSLYEVKHVFDDAPDLVVNEITGGATATHVPAESSVDLTVNNTGDKVYRRSRIWIPYEPGRSQNIFATGVFSSGVAGIRRRIGYFDPLDGLYFEQFGATDNDYSVNIRSSTAKGDQTVARASWDDPLDGTGPSGATVPLHEGAIFLIDFLWLGMDRVRFLVKYKGVVYTVYTFRHENLAGPYMARGSLPIAFEIENVSAGAVSATLRMTCAAAFSEGGFDPVGIATSASRTSGLSISGSGTSSPIISVRLKTAYQKGLLLPRSFGAVSEDNKANVIELVLGATLTGASWTSLSSASEFDVSATAITGGRVVQTIISSAGTSGREVIVFKNLPGIDSAGNSDILTVRATRLQSGGSSYYGSIDFDEVL